MAKGSEPGAVTIARSRLRWLRFDDQGITVRNRYCTYRIGWNEVRSFRDGHREGNWHWSAHSWVLVIVLHNGREIAASGTLNKKTALPETLRAIRQAAARYEIPAQLTGDPRERDGSPSRPGLYRDPGGKPGSRQWDGSEWSPLLQADPASSGQEAGKPAEVWSPLLESEQQWHGAAARARRATIWFAVWMIASAGAVAGTVALLRHNADPSGLYQMALAAVLICLGGAGVAWESRRKFRKIDRARKAAAGLAGASDGTGSPLHAHDKDPAAGARQGRCLECGADSPEVTQICAWCGAPIAISRP